MERSFVQLFEDSIKQNWDKNALSNYKGDVFTYGGVGQEIVRLHDIYSALGVNPGDKVAIYGKNSAQWGIIYIATVCYGAVIVPVLPDFKADSCTEILNHSDAKILFTQKNLCQVDDREDGLCFDSLKYINVTFDFDNTSILNCKESVVNDDVRTELRAIVAKDYSEIDAKAIEFTDSDPEAPAVISYTSGTTGFSKGVVLPHRSLTGNMHFARTNMPLNSGDSIVSFLPLAHTYGCAFEFLFPFTIGCHITILTRTPSPAIITQAFQAIRPALILSVPLVIEKVYKHKLKPELETPKLKFMTKIPLLKNIVYKKIRQKVYETFGGNFRELVVGGAAFNAEAETFFRKINFPFTVGYGMTECGPLIGYRSWDETEVGASGRAVDALEVRIDSEDQENIVGEILAKGSHVMSGYYKNPEATSAIIDEEGWLHTGDLGVIDKKGNIYIKGRSKSMILGASGKNIYPEEIESILNNLPLVVESVVVSRKEKLVALVFPDADKVKALGLTPEAVELEMKDYRKLVNSKLASYMQITKIELRDEDFAKTPKRSIKRYLYQ